MAYQVPPRWLHGSQDVKAAEMNKYSDSLNAIYAAQEDGLQLATVKRDSSNDGDHLEKAFYFVNRWRWLWYWTTSGQTTTIVDPSGVGSDVTLPDVVAMTAYDLASISWIAAGTIYRVSYADYATEDLSA